MPVVPKELSGHVISPDRFSGLMSFLASISGDDLLRESDLAVAVSGGGDSLALAVLLLEWCGARGIRLHALTVDHGLRPESAAEAAFVAKFIRDRGGIHQTLVWDDLPKPTTRIQEAARAARYRLMAAYCGAHSIKYLGVAHHAQDQIETILFRIAKGTGLDGLVGMRPVQPLENGMTLLRPLLSVSHVDLLEILRDQNIDWVEDPSNANERYARVRIRNVIGVLEGEGLSADRIMTLSARLADELNLIDYLVDNEYKKLISSMDTKRIEILFPGFLMVPIAGKIRILKRMMRDLPSPDSCQEHVPDQRSVRLEDLTRLATRMNPDFRGATLGQWRFQRKKDLLICSHL